MALSKLFKLILFFVFGRSEANQLKRGTTIDVGLGKRETKGEQLFGLLCLGLTVLVLPFSFLMGRVTPVS